jgi:N utilization substance protein B
MMMGQEGEAATDPRPVGGSSRRRAREVALQVLYAIDLGTDRPRRQQTEPDPVAEVVDSIQPDAPATGSDDSVDPDESGLLADRIVAIEGSDADRVFDVIAAHFEMPESSRVFARELAVSVRARLEQVDAAIVRHARNWRLVRMAVVDRNILRLGSYELAFTDTPVAVVLNEAVDLARRFGSDASPAFVNGILDAIARETRRTAS